MVRFTLSKLRKIRKKRTGKTLRTWGWICVALGGILLFNLGDPLYSKQQIIAESCVFAAVGVVLLIYASIRTSKWDRYESAVNNNGNTKLSYIAQTVKKPNATVKRDLQEMINNYFFIGPNYDIETYINGEYDLLIMTRNGEPIEPIDEAIARYKAEEAAKNDPLKDNPNIKAIRGAIKSIDDEEMLDSLFRIEGSLVRIERHIKEKPELANMTDVKKLRETFLPKVLVLVKKFQNKEGTAETLNEIKSAVDTTADAFGNIEAKMFERDDVDTLVDIEVLRNTLSREGLLDSDFDIKTK